MRRANTYVAFLLAAAFAYGASGVPTPAPLVRGSAVDETAVAAFDRGELTAVFEARFDAQPSVGSPTALFAVGLEADGRVKVTIPAEATSFEGDFTCRSRRTVAKGEWHRYAVIYSLLRQRVVFLIDDVLEYENDVTYLPNPDFGRAASDAFSGEVRDFRAWDVELETERFTPDPAAPGKMLFETRTEANEKALGARLKAEFAQHPAAVRTDALVAYTTDPVSQERVMPDAIPLGADFSGSVDVILAQDEFEPASLVVMARKPVGSFTVRMGPLACNGTPFPAEAVDIRLVKRWFRAGGAWVNYFADFRHRVLVPHLLVYDDDLIRVDELRTRNCYRLDYPEGIIYTDVSDPRSGRHRLGADVPFNDAKELRPVRSLTAFGRNQQYWILFHAAKGTKPGLYTGALDLVADGKTVAKMPVRLRVLPFALPVRGASYDDPSRTYYSHLNVQGSFSRGSTVAEMRESAVRLFKSLREHNSLDVSRVRGNDAVAALAREAGLPDDRIWGGPPVPDWKKFYPGKTEFTVAEHALGLRAAERTVRAQLDYYADRFPKAEKWCLFFSEWNDFGALNINQQERAKIVHKYGWNVFSHAMSQNNFAYAADIQEGCFGTDYDRNPADLWHAIGGMTANYAAPFASPENPAVHRRNLGFHRWKDLHMDGNMQHGLMDVNPNEFAPDPGGDGEFRCNIMMYPTQRGFLETICWEGVREGFDDVRYGTLLKSLAAPHLKDRDDVLRREAKRALAWLELQDCTSNDMQAMRLGIIDRILVLQDLIARKK